jgi:hypothetical protein
MAVKLSGILGCCIGLISTFAWGGVLIKASEASLPPAPNVQVATRAITRGPSIRVLVPDPGSPAITSPFAMHIVFEPRGGSRIDASSVKLIYLRGNGIDLTDRIKGGISDKGIEFKDAEAPPGEHQLRVYVQDSEGRQANALFNLNVTK